MTALVLDASVAIASILEDEADAHADAAMAAAVRGGSVAPRLLWVEARNVLLVVERRGRLTGEAIAEAYLLLGRMSGEFDDAPRSDAVMGLARAHNLSAYDALYLELAIRRQLPLATLDKRLAGAAEAEGRLWTPS